MLNVTRREMTRAYRNLKDVAQHLRSAVQVGDARHGPRHLTLVYAAECGIKAVLMKERKADTYADLAEGDRIGHDLRRGLKRLGWPGKLSRNYTTKQKDPQNVSHERLHEAFRYGVELANEDAIVLELEDVISWVKERLEQ
jgi:hypothetical protein